MDTVFEEKEAWTAGEQFCIDGRNNWTSSVPYSYFKKHLDGSTTTETPSTDHGWSLFIWSFDFEACECSDCKVGFTLKSIWIEKQRGSIETWEDCRDKCNDDNEYHPGNNNNQHWPCTHFKFKVKVQTTKVKYMSILYRIIEKRENVFWWPFFSLKKRILGHQEKSFVQLQQQNRQHH